MRAIRSGVVVGALLTLLAVGCEGSPSPLSPRNEPTARIAELGWVMIVLGSAACVVTITALGAALVSSRRRVAPDVREPEDNRVIVIGGMVIPGVVLAVTLGYTIVTLRYVAGSGGPGGAAVLNGHAEHGHPLAERGAGSSLSLEITGTQWWWRVSYADEQVITANEIHVPVGVSVRVAVTSEDVIHSFWIPQVMGKVDMIPARTNVLVLRVDRPGVFRGMCAEFCGFQHARMHLRLFVDRAEEFAGWLANERRDAVMPTEPRLVQGQRVFIDAGCGECHAVRGTPAAGRRGPDLTHLASRRTLGAGTQENNRANLTGWTIDPQAMKPGNRMPSTTLSQAELEPLLAYLESLR